MDSLLITSLIFIIIGYGLSIYVWIICNSIDPYITVIMCFITTLFYSVIAFIGYKTYKKTNKRYYLIFAIIILLSGLLLMIFRNQVYVFFLELFSPIGPGPLPNRAPLYSP